MGVASIPLTEDGYDTEFNPLRAQIKNDLGKLWDLPFDELVQAWAAFPPALYEGAPTMDEIDARLENVPVRDGEKVEAQIYRPKDAKEGEVLPLFLALHGGGWALARHGVEEGMNRAVCVKNRCVVVSVEYRKPPQYKFPYPVNDSFDVLQWCRKNASTLSIDPNKVLIGGSSAGGNLAAAVVQKLRDEGALDGVLGQVLNFPVTCHPDLFDEARKRFPGQKFDSYEENKDAYIVAKKNMLWLWGLYTDNKPEPHPYASPILASSLAGLPPALVQIGEKDPLRDEGLAYEAALRAAGNKTRLNFFPGLPHCFNFFPLTQSIKYHENTVEFVGELLGQRK